MTVRVILRAAAVRDLEAAYTWYESQRLGLGEVFLGDIRHVHAQLARHPGFGSSVARRTRQIALIRFPYVLLYVLEADQVVVTAVLHSHRDPRRRSERVQERSASAYAAAESFVSA